MFIHNKIGSHQAVPCADVAWEIILRSVNPVGMEGHTDFLIWQVHRIRSQGAD